MPPTFHHITLEWKIVLESLLFEFILSSICYQNFPLLLWKGRKGEGKWLSLSVVRLSLCKLPCDHALHINTEDVWVRTPETTLKRPLRAQGLTDSRHYHVGCHIREDGVGWGGGRKKNSQYHSFIPPLNHSSLPSFV